MPVWCPECNAMLPEGIKECLRCGAELDDQHVEGQKANREDLFWYSAFTIGAVLILIIIGVVIGLICILIFILT